jgi:hypothetical protein
VAALERGKERVERQQLKEERGDNRGSIKQR